MRVWMKVLLAVGAVMLLGGCASRSHRQVDAIFAEWNRPDSPGMAVAVIRDGRTILARGYGMANLEHGIPITPESRFYIGSTSKQFVAASIMLLEEDGLLSLDDDVRKHVPEMPDYGATITVRHLLTHTSGLKDYLSLWREKGGSWFDAVPEERVLVMIAAEPELNHPTGARYQYTNSGYFLLALIVKRVSGKPLSQFADERIFQPLGMVHSHFHDDRTRLIPNRAFGHLRRRDGTMGQYMSAFDLVGSGGLYTTLGDLAKWDANYYSNRLGKGGPELFERMTTPMVLNDGSRTEYGLGLMLGEYRGLPKVSHSGSFVGFRAEMLRFPEERFTVIVLANAAETNSPQLARRVAEVHLGEKMAAEGE